MRLREPSQLNMFQFNPPCVKCGGMTVPASAATTQESERALRTFECTTCRAIAVVKIPSG